MVQIALTSSGSESSENFEHQWSGDCLQVHLLSDVGRKRSQNEDACMLCMPEEQPAAEQQGILFAVADGMGGVSGGALASRIALDTIAEAFYAIEDGTIPDRLRRSIIAANKRVFDEAASHPEYRGMGTTVSAVAVRHDYAYIGQVGDSRVYLCRHGMPITQLTEDHSLVAEQVRGGLLSEEEARTHSLKNLITRAVGTRENLKVDLFRLHLQQNDNLLICSDGLSNVVSDEEIAQAMSVESLQGVGRLLVGRALRAGAPDNVTAAALRVIRTPRHESPDEDALDVTPSRTSFFQRLKRFFM